MKQYIHIVCLFLIPAAVLGQSFQKDLQRYEEAYQELDSMLNGSIPMSFKRAVFLTENTFEQGGLNETSFENHVLLLAKLVRSHALASKAQFIYEGDDRETVLTWASIFRVMTDTLTIQFSETSVHKHLPYRYDFEDFMGTTDWRKMFVSKLLHTHKGNCHSLPFLYKIIAEELDVSAHLALAPNHMYIKHYCEQDGMYNTELTSQCFPIDAWLMATERIHLTAIRKGVYMDTLTANQSIALCLVDLAMGYKRLYGTSNDDFLMKCVDRAIAEFPQYTHALLLKSELLKAQMDRIAEENGLPSINQALHLQPVAERFAEIEEITVQLYHWGYRKMPEDMYLNWLADLHKNKAKYANTHLTKQLNTINKNEN